MRARIALPHCLTCGKPCRRRWCAKGRRTKYCSNACVPRSARVDGGRRGRQRAIAAARVKLYQAQLKRLQGLERITGEDLVATFAEISAHGYQRGYGACEIKWRERQGKAA